MSAYSPSSGSPMIRYAIGAWILALAVFLVWLVLKVFQGPPDYMVLGEDAKTAADSSAGDMGLVVDNLLPMGASSAPRLSFPEGAEYVLSGFGLQGFYQTVPENKAWTISLPLPTLTAQLIKRGDGLSPVTENVVLTWEIQTPETDGGEGAKRGGQMEPDKDGLSFTAQVPVSARQRGGTLNPYPVVRITATDKTSRKVLAESAAVLAVAPGFGCALCHADTEYAILDLHDRRQNTALREMAEGGAPVDCRTCHDGLSQDGNKTVPGIGMSLSASIHGWHTPYLAGRESDACLACHAGLGRSAETPDGSPQPLFARDLHSTKGLNCINCHGSLEDHSLALLKAEQEAGQESAQKAIDFIKPRAVAGLDAVKPRLPWVQLPGCAACHDFEKKPVSDTVSGFNAWTEDASGLFSRRTDGMSVLRCPTCHGAPHALYPADNPVVRGLDNMVPIQYQRDARPLGGSGNCALCHMQGKEMSAHHPLVERPATKIHVPENA